MTVQIIDCEQGSIEWRQARLGIPSASEFGSILAKGEGKMRRSYMLRLASEIVTGEPLESYTNQYMDRGKAQEDEARTLYAFSRDVEPVQVGFLRNGRVGCSPDSLIGDAGGLEIKTKRGDHQIECLLKGKMPSEHLAQVQGNLWVSERDWWDFVAYSPALPLFVSRVRRDDAYIATLAGEVDRFNDELAALVEQVRRYGTPLKAQLEQSLAEVAP